MATATYSQENVQTALDEAAQVTKKQRVCETGVDACFDRLIAAAQEARSALGRGGAAQDVISRLSSQLEAVLKEANSQTKELHTAVSKLSKVMCNKEGFAHAQLGFWPC
jgi:seryl-tRNA synthetase